MVDSNLQREEVLPSKKAFSYKMKPPRAPAKQMEDTIIKALEMYRKRQRDRER